jgi:hypothetical protein
MVWSATSGSLQATADWSYPLIGFAAPTAYYMAVSSVNFSVFRIMALGRFLSVDLDGWKRPKVWTLLISAG